MEPPVASTADDLTNEFAALDPSARGALVVKRLGLLYRGKFNILELDVLADKVTSGELDGAQVLQEAYKALSRLEGDAFVATLRIALTD